MEEEERARVRVIRVGVSLMVRVMIPSSDKIPSYSHPMLKRMPDVDLNILRGPIKIGVQYLITEAWFGIVG